MRSLDVVLAHHRHDVPLRRADRDGDVLGLRIEFGEHVARVIVEPLRLRLRGLRRKRDRAADLQDHLRHGLPEQSDEVIVLIEVDRPFSGRGVAHVDMQHGGAGVVAVDRHLHLLIPGHRDVGVARQPLWPEGRHRNDQGLPYFPGGSNRRYNTSLIFLYVPFGAPVPASKEPARRLTPAGTSFPGVIPAPAAETRSGPLARWRRCCPRGQ